MGIDDVINTKLLLHPMNWLIVWIVMIFAGFAWVLIHEHVTATSPAASLT